MLSRPQERYAGPKLAMRAAVGCLALSAGLAACGSGGGPAQRNSPQSAKVVRAAYAKTTGADTVSVSFEGDKQAAAKGKKQGKGAASKQPVVSGTSTLDFTRNASEVTVDGNGKAGSTTRTIDGVQYRKIPAKQRSQVPGKKPWIKINMEKVAKLQYGDKAHKIAHRPPTDPVGILSYLRAVTQAHKSGMAQVRGTDTTRYATTIDLGKASGSKSLQAAQQAKQIRKQLGKRNLGMTVWLDGDHRVRRLSAKLPAGGRSGSGQRILITEDFYNYGKPSGLAPPSKSSTADVTKQVVQRQQMQMRRQMMQRQQQMQQRQQQMQQQGKQRQGQPQGG